MRRRLQIKVIPVDVISPDSLVSRCAEFIERGAEGQTLMVWFGRWSSCGICYNVRHETVAQL